MIPKCDIDTFREEDIDACYSFPLPGYAIPKLRVQHSGLDAWKGVYFRFVFRFVLYKLDAIKTHCICKNDTSCFCSTAAVAV